MAEVTKPPNFWPLLSEPSRSSRSIRQAKPPEQERSELRLLEMELTQELLKELLHYDPETGIFTWRDRSLNHCASRRAMRTFNSRWAGTEAGTKKNDGYLRIRFLGQLTYLHRLGVLYMTGTFPALQVDHINGVRDDNRWANLRLVNNSENHRNMKMPTSNKSGVVGVFWGPHVRKWRAQIRVEYKPHRLGDYSDFFEAVCARKSAERKYGFHLNHGRG